MKSQKEEKTLYNAERAQRFLDRTHFSEIRHDDQAFEELIQSMSYQEFRKYLIFLNGAVRDAPKSERGFAHGMITGSGLIAPNIEIQEEYLEKGFNAIKSIKDNHHRAALAYYLINELHLFGDGNGRTSRLLYEIINNQDFSLVSQPHFFSHDKFNLDKSRQSDFEERNSIKGPELADNLAMYEVFQDYVKSGQISNDPRLINKGIITTFGGGEVYLNEGVANDLDFFDLQMTKRALLDNNRCYDSPRPQYTVSGTVMSIMETKKGLINGCLDRHDEKLKKALASEDGDDCDFATRFTFRVGNNYYSQPDAVAETNLIFSGWTADDYRAAIDLADEVKSKQLDYTIDFFVNPDKYKLSNNTTVASYLAQ